MLDIKKFKILAKEWSKGCELYSFWHMMEKHPAHGELLKMGSDIVPFVLKIMKKDHWIGWGTLLGEITGEKPDYIPEEDGGFVKISVTDFAEAWIRWGVKKGLIHD